LTRTRGAESAAVEVESSKRALWQASRSTTIGGLLLERESENRWSATRSPVVYWTLAPARGAVGGVVGIAAGQDVPGAPGRPSTARDTRPAVSRTLDAIALDHLISHTVFWEVRGCYRRVGGAGRPSEKVCPGEGLWRVLPERGSPHGPGRRAAPSSSGFVLARTRSPPLRGRRGWAYRRCRILSNPT
jgi:hypothetical protein